MNARSDWLSSPDYDIAKLANCWCLKWTYERIHDSSMLLDIFERSQIPGCENFVSWLRCCIFQQTTEFCIYSVPSTTGYFEKWNIGNFPPVSPELSTKAEVKVSNRDPLTVAGELHSQFNGGVFVLCAEYTLLQCYPYQEYPTDEHELLMRTDLHRYNRSMQQHYPLQTWEAVCINGVKVLRAGFVGGYAFLPNEDRFEISVVTMPVGKCQLFVNRTPDIHARFLIKRKLKLIIDIALQNNAVALVIPCSNMFQTNPPHEVAAILKDVMSMYAGESIQRVVLCANDDTPNGRNNWDILKTMVG